MEFLIIYHFHACYLPNNKYQRNISKIDKYLLYLFLKILYDIEYKNNVNRRLAIKVITLECRIFVV